MGRWRAVVLVTVHVIIAIHVGLWLAMGSTLSPVEPSESMQTLELGVINAGFIFFVLALLSTLLFGRFFCGWGCHVIALQDACAWLMKRVGIRPKQFRSRLLLWVPVALAFYMFLWPNFKRFILRPLLGESLPFWLKDVPRIDRFQTEFLVDDFWATFADWYLAIPTLLIAGFGAVYFLGSKGFCTYGCPYGGFFGPVDRLAPGRIRVTDDCEHCGHCTASCTSNVRVHEEVRDFGMVVDPGCMKCMDCVSVCPNDALYIGLGKPAILASPRAGAEESAKKAKASRARRYDLSLGEELVAGVVFIWLFFAFRQAFDAVPMLMAVGIAGCGTVATWTLWSIVLRPNVTLQGKRLKTKGRVRPAGLLFIVPTIAFLLFAGWLVAVRHEIWRGTLAHNQLDVPLETALRPEFSPRDATTDAARDTVRHFERVRTVGWGLTPDRMLHLTYAHVVLGERDEAVAILRERIELGMPIDNLVVQLGQLMMWSGDSQQEVIDTFAWAADLHPELNLTRQRAAQAYSQAYRSDDGSALWERALLQAPDAPGTMIGAARFRAIQDDRAGAESLAVRVASHDDASPDERLNAAGLLNTLGKPDIALETIESVLAMRHVSEGARLNAASMLASLGERDRAGEVLDGIVEHAGRSLAIIVSAIDGARRLGFNERADRWIEKGRPLAAHRPGPALGLGRQLLYAGKIDAGMQVLAGAADHPDLSVWDRFSFGSTLVRDGAGLAIPALTELGIQTMRASLDEAPDSVILRHDFAQALLATGQPDDALARLIELANEVPSNPALAQRVAEALTQLGRPDEAAPWAEEARDRFLKSQQGG